MRRPLHLSFVTLGAVPTIELLAITSLFRRREGPTGRRKAEPQRKGQHARHAAHHNFARPGPICFGHECTPSLSPHSFAAWQCSVRQTPVSLAGLFRETFYPSRRHIKKGDRWATLFTRQERALFPIHRKGDQRIPSHSALKTIARIDIHHPVDNGRSRTIERAPARLDAIGALIFLVRVVIPHHLAAVGRIATQMPVYRSGEHNPRNSRHGGGLGGAALFFGRRSRAVGYTICAHPSQCHTQTYRHRHYYRGWCQNRCQNPARSLPQYQTGPRTPVWHPPPNPTEYHQSGRPCQPAAATGFPPSGPGSMACITPDFCPARMTRLPSGKIRRMGGRGKVKIGARVPADKLVSSVCSQPTFQASPAVNCLDHRNSPVRRSKATTASLVREAGSE